MAPGVQAGTTETAPPSPLTPALGSASETHRYYVLVAIWIVLVLRTVDLQVISVLIEPIRAEFHVSDTQLGLLTGTAFALLYAILGLPVALLADRYNRRNILAVCLALWSGMTALCGMAGSFGSLLLARIGVGVGEAGGAPPAYALMSDYFPPERRSTIFSVLNTAVPMGVFAGLIIGGYVSTTFGWRTTLISIGCFGFVIAAIVRFTVLEPVRGRADRQVVVSRSSMAETVRYLWAKRSYRHLVMATSIATLGAMGSGIWIVSFFVRVHHMPVGQVSLWIGLIYGGGGVLGAMLGGTIADALTKKHGDWRWQGWLSAITVTSILPFSFFVYLWPVATTALLVQIGTVILLHSWMGSAYGTVQSLAGPSRRAVAAAINLLVVNLVALGCGPLLVGVLSDFFTARFGENSLRYAILSLVVVTFPWAGLHFFLAARTLREDLRS